MTLDRASLGLLGESLDRLDAGFGRLPPFAPAVDVDAMRAVLLDVAERLHDNFPYPHPLYAGQMLKPPHPVARIAYQLAQWINPNNHALDGGRASSAMEKEAVAALASMCGWERHLGHLCGGGTMANLEALWVAGRLHPDKTVLASSQAHYTHARISEVLQLDFEAVPVDACARLDLSALAQRLDRGGVGTVVVTLGTTGTGSVDPLPEILDLQERHGFRIHVDAAYGGYFTLARNLAPATRAACDALGRADSIVIDPHKHGLQPYGCGCVLFRDPAVGRIYRHDSPYTYFSSDELHLGEISLECSRPGAAAVALWATLRFLPPVRGGAFARDLERCREAAQELFRRLEQDARYRTAFPPELDIVVWAPRGARASEISRRSRALFARAAERQLHLALMAAPASILRPHWPDVDFDEASVTCLRSCLMKPEHLDWLPAIWRILEEIAAR
ncbi:MAG: pyridoxal phosphate-dependent decarboxylase family protein [Planctomycetota bacterium]|jgi:glutamate/tyrosine decarboxylase-like PLP-dependent enzyme